MSEGGFPEVYGPSRDGNANSGADPELLRRVMDDIHFGDAGSTPVTDAHLILGTGGGMQPPVQPPEALVDQPEDGRGRGRLVIVHEDGSETTLEIIDD